MGRPDLCDKCKKVFDGAKPGTMREVHGWEVVRTRGGANQIKNRTETGRVLCPACSVDFRYAGSSDTQPQLF